MMVGKNKIELNQETLHKAFEFYLDYIFSERTGTNKVESVDMIFNSTIVTFEKQEVASPSDLNANYCKEFLSQNKANESKFNLRSGAQ